MWNNWIGRRIRASGRTLLICGLLACAGAAVIGWRARDDFSIALLPPIVLDAEALATATPDGRLDRTRVTFTPSDMFEQVAAAPMKEGSDKRLVRLVAVRAGDRWLYAKIPVNHEGTTLTGMLVFEEKPGADPAVFLPLLLDCARDTRRGALVALFFMATLLLPGLVFAVTGLRRLLRPDSHPLAKALKRFGQPAEVANAIDRGGRPLRLGPIEFAGDWLVCNAPRTGITVFSSDDLVWMHKLIDTVNRTPLHRIKLYDRRGMMFTGGGRPDVIDAAIAAITAKRPWIVIGWDDRIEKQWKDDPASLVPRVEERRRELLERTPRPDVT